MRIRLIQLLPVVFTISMLGEQADAQSKRHFQHVGVERGLHSYEMIDISLDPQGFLWFGYPDAVSRFDGYLLREFTGSIDDTNDIAHSTPVSRV